jgi:hypothetical protein
MDIKKPSMKSSLYFLFCGLAERSHDDLHRLIQVGDLRTSDDRAKWVEGEIESFDDAYADELFNAIFTFGETPSIGIQSGSENLTLSSYE